MNQVVGESCDARSVGWKASVIRMRNALLCQTVIEKAERVITRLNEAASISSLDEQLPTAHFNRFKRIEACYQVARFFICRVICPTRTTAIQNLHVVGRVKFE